MSLIDYRAIFAALATLKSNWPGSAWSWDGRMGCCASSFPATLEAAARAVASAALPTFYTEETIATAPPSLVRVAEDSGGLRAGQLLFLGGEPARLVFGLWWPWRGGATISLRVGLVDAEADDEGTDGPGARLRQLFGLG